MAKPRLIFMRELKLFERGEAQTLIPLYAEAIHAGFESPAADYEEEKVFFARVTGECMVGSGIFPDDLLVVDRSLQPNSGDIVVGIIDNEFILRSYFKKGNKEYLMPDNKYFKPIEQNEITHFEIWGVVLHSVLDQRRRNSGRINRFEQILRG